MLIYPTGIPEAKNQLTLFAAKSKLKIKIFDQNIQFMSSHRPIPFVVTIYFCINRYLDMIN